MKGVAGEKKDISKNTKAQPENRVNWFCLDCNYEKYKYFLDKAPKRCPRCGSENTVDLRIKKGID